ncbi:ferric reductase-like transmembrane domain-containing protein [Thioalkalivibrio sp. XN8]|uniref:ferredoxin reductase family protein n=1 Tax=Thioalkalivibrio sp. XN8 TaxID=2712863 RepID=UPI0013E9BE1F|nr:ferric reductase-like transmembrane domain-containing protein [Thioalkalivibrio sp. XN8]NGP52701.1 hypothetical protein [Thioalkalivibrio sp. XN8]
MTRGLQARQRGPATRTDRIFRIAATGSNRRQQILRGLNGPALLGLYLLVVLLPLVLAALTGPAGRNFWRELGSGLALVGLAMLWFEFVLSGRFRTFSGKVGIDITMRVHQLAALALLGFLVLHPLAYAVPRLADDPGRVLPFLARLFTAEAYRSGVLAWLLLLVLVPMAFWRDRLPCRYEAWRASHGLLAALAAGFGLHHTLSVGSRSDHPALAGLWLALAGVALLTLLFVYVVKPLLQHRRPYLVTANRQVAPRTWELRLRPEHDAAMDFLAGQFAWLNVGHSPFSLTEHPFSISSAPADLPEVGFSIKQSGDFTGRIGEVPVGTRAWLDGPHGHFVVPADPHERLVFIAGGVGFAPVMSILRQLRATGSKLPLTLLYGNRIEAQVLYRGELEAMAAEMPLDLRLVLSEPPPGWRGLAGQLSGDLLAGCLDPERRSGWLYFVCGPPPMMRSVEHTLVGFGVPSRRIIAEHFKYD